MSQAPRASEDSESAALAYCKSRRVAVRLCSSSGSFHRSVRIPALRMYIRNVTLHFGRTHARALMPQVLEMLAAGTLDPRPIVTTVASLHDAPAAIGEHMRSDDVKTVLVA